MARKANEKEEKQYKTAEEFCAWYADASNHFQHNLSDFVKSFTDYVWEKTDITEEIKKLDETPLTRKGYEKRLAELKKSVSVFTYTKEMNENDLYKMLIIPWMKEYAYVEYGLDTKLAEAVAKYIWKEYDICGLLLHFDEPNYYEANYRHYSESESSEYNLYNRNKYYTYQNHLYAETIIKNIMGLIVSNKDLTNSLYMEALDD